MAEAVMPGFINLRLSGQLPGGPIWSRMRVSPRASALSNPARARPWWWTTAGANVAKPLHIGHLRPAIIGESLKRLYTYLGYNAIGDVHLGDWGLQMGLIIAELQRAAAESSLF